ncbi:hypothetical protein A3SI_03790 [Nitritalea halalkaliphila LW7]|uniref:Uncharacterized protein n=1 Tax=Nitritalea halalkaliphila LW7 TaxID=1189621 RepID=I5C966_9BACT|nr:hypothetical protein [Nitritalea halalkaliphila]EIM78368.1 hypothetical protein A3SI_03790 [Nitritalea halalkaliphila LW7]
MEWLKKWFLKRQLRKAERASAGKTFPFPVAPRVVGILAGSKESAQACKELAKTHIPGAEQFHVLYWQEETTELEGFNENDFDWMALPEPKIQAFIDAEIDLLIWAEPEPSAFSLLLLYSKRSCFRMGLHQRDLEPHLDLMCQEGR